MTKEPFNEHQWSTVIFKSTLMWWVKGLINRLFNFNNWGKQPEIVFCWGQDQWTTSGFLGEEYFSIGGLSDKMKKKVNV